MTTKDPFEGEAERHPGFICGEHHDVRNPPEITYETILTLADDRCDPQLLERYADHRFSIVRCMVALNRNASVSLLYSLGLDDDESVRGCAASNPSSEPKFAETISEDDHPIARAGAARHPGICDRTILRLDNDSDSQVRGAIRHNPAYQKLMNTLRASAAIVREMRQKSPNDTVTK